MSSGLFGFVSRWRPRGFPALPPIQRCTAIHWFSPTRDLSGLPTAVHDPSTMPKSDALVTVVIPAYNAASTIEQTLASVSVQTYEEIEIVVVDDGSSDKTFELAQDYARKHERMRVVSQTNAGVAAARNLGTEVADGSLIAF